MYAVLHHRQLATLDLAYGLQSKPLHLMFTSINHVNFMSHCDSVIPQNKAQITYKKVYQSMLPICPRSDKEDLFHLNLSLWWFRKGTFSVETKKAPLPIIESIVIHMYNTMIVFQLLFMFLFFLTKLLVHKLTYMLQQSINVYSSSPLYMHNKCLFIIILSPLPFILLFFVITTNITSYSLNKQPLIILRTLAIIVIESSFITCFDQLLSSFNKSAATHHTYQLFLNIPPSTQENRLL